MDTAANECEIEVYVLQLYGLQILNRTIFPTTADEVWSTVPPCNPRNLPCDLWASQFCAEMKN